MSTRHRRQAAGGLLFAAALAGGLGVLLFAQAVYLGTWVLAVALAVADRESLIDDSWFLALWGVGLVLLPLTVLTAYSQRGGFLGRVVLLTEVLGAGAVVALVLASFVPYAAGWGGRKLDEAGGEIGWQAALVFALAMFVPPAAAGGGVLAAVVSGARQLLGPRLHTR